MKSKRMRLSAIVDLYYLESVVIVIPPFGSRSKEKLHADALSHRDELVQSLATALYEYLWLIAWGEGRHAKSHIRRGNWYYPELTRLRRADAYRDAVAYDPRKNLPLLLKMFKQAWSDSSYGGSKWSELIEATMQYDKYPSMIYVDHVIDICHNSGLAFDKTDAGQVIPLDLDISESHLKSFLDFKRDDDLLTTHPPIELADYLSVTTFNILKRYHTLYDQSIPPWLMSPRKDTPHTPRCHWPCYTSPTWGSCILDGQATRSLPKGTKRVQIPYAYHGYKIKIGLYFKSKPVGPVRAAV